MLTVSTTKKKAQIGDCEVGTACNNAVNTEVFLTPGNILMCQACIDEQAKLTEKYAQANAVIQAATKVDQTIHLSSDIYNAKTVPIIEIHASIQQDENIPVDEKSFVFSTECERHILLLKERMTKRREEQAADDIELRAWITAQTTEIAKLRVDLQGQFTARRIDYAPTKPKTIKPAKEVKPKVNKAAKASMSEVKAAAEKYGVSPIMVRLITESKPGTSAEDAAKGLLKDLPKKQQN